MVIRFEKLIFEQWTEKFRWYAWYLRVLCYKKINLVYYKYLQHFDLANFRIG